MLVGKGPDEPQLRAQIERLGLKDRVRMEIAVPDERLYQLYEAALGVYYGPFDEDYGYVTIEGFAAERPVVTLTDSGGPLEFVTRRRDRTDRARPSPRRSPRRSTGSSPIVRPPGAWAGPGTRSCAPRSRDGPTSSRGCWTR